MVTGADLIGDLEEVSNVIANILLCNTHNGDGLVGVTSWLLLRSGDGKSKGLGDGDSLLRWDADRRGWSSDSDVDGLGLGLSLGLVAVVLGVGGW